MINWCCSNFCANLRCRYGKVFKSHIFGSPTIVSTDAEVSRFVLQSDAKTFVPWYPKSLTELMGKSSILLINGSLQKKVHGLIGAFFKSPHLKAQITRDMQCYVLEAMNHWKDDQLIHIQDESKRVSPLSSLLLPLTKNAHVWCGTRQEDGQSKWVHSINEPGPGLWFRTYLLFSPSLIRGSIRSFFECVSE